MKLAEGAQRVGIFAFYDPDGVVDEYIPVLVGAVRRHCAYLLCVVNGRLGGAGRAQLAAVCDEIWQRPNEGLDVTAYKEGLFHLGQRARGADELLFFNQTVFGPIFPLGEMFGEMAGRELDFWGMTEHRGLQADLENTIWQKVEYGYLPRHIQSYFFAVRRPMLQSESFWEYWRTLPPVHDYVEAVSFHEVRFTKYFTDLGFTGQAYLDCTGWEPYADYPLMADPAGLLREKRAPLVKRKSFLSPRTDYLSLPQGGAGGALLAALAADTDYPVRLVLQNLTRTVPAAELARALAPSASPAGAGAAGGGSRVALVAFMKEAAFAPLAAGVAQRLPAGSEAFVLLAPGAQEKEIRAQLGGAQFFAGQPGGLAGLFGPLWGQLQGFDAVLYLPFTTPPDITGLVNANLIRTGVAALGDPLADLAMLDSLPGVKVLLPVPDMAGEGFCDRTPLAELPQLAALLQAEGGPLAGLPLGGALWRLPGSAFFARPATLQPLAALDWGQPPLSGGEDAGAEYLLPLAAQRAGGLCGFSAPWADAVRELWNAREQLRQMNAIFATPAKKRPALVFFRMRGVLKTYQERRFQMTLEQAFAAKLSFRQKLWIILQLLLPPAAFRGLRRLLYGGKLPPAPPPPRDELD